MSEREREREIQRQRERGRYIERERKSVGIKRDTERDSQRMLGKEKLFFVPVCLLRCYGNRFSNILKHFPEFSIVNMGKSDRWNHLRINRLYSVGKIRTCPRAS